MTCIAQTVFTAVLEITCRWCSTHFCVCQSCWRGRCYCSERCREAAGHKAHRESQRRYRRTEKGRQNHREGEKRRRMGLSRKCEEIVDDAGTTQPYRSLKMESADPKDSNAWVQEHGYRVCRCHVCGCLGIIVQRFGRRGYGRGLREMEVGR
jgi:hypothetical protein